MLYWALPCYLLSLALFAANGAQATWFSEIEAVAHAIVEYVPLIGTIYSIERSVLAIAESKTKLFWASVADAIECTVRDVIILSEYEQPLEVVILHSMTESLTETLLDIHHSRHHEIRTNKTLDITNHHHVMVAESVQNKLEDHVWKSKAKGVFNYFDSTWSGRLHHSIWAPTGPHVHLYAPRGFYDGAPLLLSWKWSKDGRRGQKKVVELRGTASLTRIGSHTGFNTRDVKAIGGGEAYEFWGWFRTKTLLQVCIQMDTEPYCSDFTRQRASNHGIKPNDGRGRSDSTSNNEPMTPSGDVDGGASDEAGQGISDEEIVEVDNKLVQRLRESKTGIHTGGFVCSGGFRNCYVS